MDQIDDVLKVFDLISMDIEDSISQSHRSQTPSKSEDLSTFRKHNPCLTLETKVNLSKQLWYKLNYGRGNSLMTLQKQNEGSFIIRKIDEDGRTGLVLSYSCGRNIPHKMRSIKVDERDGYYFLNGCSYLFTSLEQLVVLHASRPACLSCGLKQLHLPPAIQAAETEQEIEMIVGKCGATSYQQNQQKLLHCHQQHYQQQQKYHQQQQHGQMFVQQHQQSQLQQPQLQQHQLQQNQLQQQLYHCQHKQLHQSNTSSLDYSFSYKSVEDPHSKILFRGSCGSSYENFQRSNKDFNDHAANNKINFNNVYANETIYDNIGSLARINSINNSINNSNNCIINLKKYKLRSQHDQLTSASSPFLSLMNNPNAHVTQQTLSSSSSNTSSRHTSRDMYQAHTQRASSNMVSTTNNNRNCNICRVVSMGSNNSSHHMPFNSLQLANRLNGLSASQSNPDTLDKLINPLPSNLLSIPEIGNDPSPIYAEPCEDSDDNLRKYLEAVAQRSKASSSYSSKTVSSNNTTLNKKLLSSNNTSLSNKVENGFLKVSTNYKIPCDVTPSPKFHPPLNISDKNVFFSSLDDISVEAANGLVCKGKKDAAEQSLQSVQCELVVARNINADVNCTADWSRGYNKNLDCNNGTRSNATDHNFDKNVDDDNISDDVYIEVVDKCHANWVNVHKTNSLSMKYQHQQDHHNEVKNNSYNHNLVSSAEKKFTSKNNVKTTPLLRKNSNTCRPAPSINNGTQMILPNKPAYTFSSPPVISEVDIISEPHYQDVTSVCDNSNTTIANSDSSIKLANGHVNNPNGNISINNNNNNIDNYINNRLTKCTYDDKLSYLNSKNTRTPNANHETETDLEDKRRHDAYLSALADLRTNSSHNYNIKNNRFSEINYHRLENLESKFNKTMAHDQKLQQQNQQLPDETSALHQHCQQSPHHPKQLQQLFHTFSLHGSVDQRLRLQLPLYHQQQQQQNVDVTNIKNGNNFKNYLISKGSFNGNSNHIKLRRNSSVMEANTSYNNIINNNNYLNNINSVHFGTYNVDNSVDVNSHVSHISEGIIKTSTEQSTFFGQICTEFIQCTLAGKEINPVTVAIHVRQFMDGMMNYLKNYKEANIWKIIENERNEMRSEEIVNMDSIYERSLLQCILKPLHKHIKLLYNTYYYSLNCHAMEQQNFTSSNNNNNNNNMISNGTKQMKLSDAIEKASDNIQLLHFKPQLVVLLNSSTCWCRDHFVNMNFTYSPNDKVQLLIEALMYLEEQVSTHFLDSLQSSHHLMVVEFSFCLSYIIIQCNFTRAEIEADYISRLLQKKLFTGQTTFFLNVFISAINIVKKYWSTHSTSNTNNSSNNNNVNNDINNNVNNNIVTNGGNNDSNASETAYAGQNDDNAGGNDASEYISNKYLETDWLMGEFVTVHMLDDRTSSLTKWCLPVNENTTAHDICNMMSYRLQLANSQEYGLYVLSGSEEYPLRGSTSIIHSSLTSSFFPLKASSSTTSSSSSSSPSSLSRSLIFKKLNNKYLWSHAK
ncbi:hypothetical protein HELRODRAFT_188031 [Helobdella robusta]|uniref:SH2 domain-containing protein n=1 Tax=Helobdella robusta TaxID=6412 RepID=T1FPK4_HELRO|nr:hypothetical protein HELRODRAFT_188031 [Helobdella robusta]ESO12899.1 hypothetical protein HELRODRAFT_188031 [Helobdella robusta]